MSERRVLVLGAAGFMGRSLVQALRQAGQSASVTVLRDERNRTELAAAFSASDAIVNATTGKPASIRAAADALYAVAAQSAARPRIVQMSSMTVYGSVEGDIDEAAVLNGDLGDYAQAQIDAERRAAHYANSVILRPGCEYGRSCPDWTERIARLLAARRLGDLGAAGDGYCNLLYIDDLMAGILAAIAKPGVAGRVFNLAMPAPPTWNEYFERFAKALGTVPIRRISQRRLRRDAKLWGPPLKMVEIVGRRLHAPSSLWPAVLSPSLLRVCSQEIRLDSRRAAAELGLQWTDLALGLGAAARSLGAKHAV